MYPDKLVLIHLDLLKKIYRYIFIIISNKRGLYSKNKNLNQNRRCPMALGKVNVFISDPNNPCSMDSSAWYVFVFTCVPHPFNFCDQKYIRQIDCKNHEITLPPGCYILIASKTTKMSYPYTYPVFVQVGCESTTCVKLFNPNSRMVVSMHQPFMENALKTKLVTKAKLTESNKLIKELSKKIPAKEVDLNLFNPKK